jgi:hypothetical protein
MNAESPKDFTITIDDPYMTSMNETYENMLEMDITSGDLQLSFDLGDDIEYAFNEKNILQEMQDYIDGTYSAHYSQNKYQSTQIIEDMGHGMGFALGNVIKYCQRYGKKEGFNRDDLKKVIHYGIIALAMHDRKE